MEGWQQWEQGCAQCRGCSLSKGRKVLGQGLPTAPVMLIVPAPTQEGRLLRQAEEGLLWEMLSLIGISPQQVYITAVVKCPPPAVRGALHIEQTTCLPWLRQEYRLLQPQVIVCLGQESVSWVMGEGVALDTHHGQWFVRSGGEMMAMEHPKILLEQGEKRPEAFADLQSLGQKLKQLKIL